MSKTNRPQGGFRVICGDGKHRHGADLFADQLSALDWADYGHACLCGHHLVWVGPR